MPKGYEMNKQLIQQLNKKRLHIASSVQFRNETMEIRKGLIPITCLYKLHGAKLVFGLDIRANII